MLNLNLSFNLFADRGASCLSQCIHNVNDMDIRHCCISHEGVSALSRAILLRSHPVNIAYFGRKKSFVLNQYYLLFRFKQINAVSLKLYL